MNRRSMKPVLIASFGCRGSDGADTANSPTESAASRGSQTGLEKDFETLVTTLRGTKRTLCAIIQLIIPGM